MNCPICNAPESYEQPQSGTHCYTTVFTCGTEIDACYGSDEWEYSQRCDEPRRRSFMDKLLYPDTFNVAYAQQKLPELCRKTIFLAGPTPRDKSTPSWRPEAIEFIKNTGYKGWVFAPEMENGWSSDFEYDDQIEWEHSGLQKASVIVFWIPRELKSMPAFTTNIEWGYWVSRKPEKIVLGYPKDSPKMKYMKYYADKLRIPVSHTLKETLENALILLDKINDKNL